MRFPLNIFLKGATLLTLIRHTSDLFGTYGVLIYGRKVLCHTFELPWRQNSKNTSCVPTGTYPVIKSNSPRFGHVFYLKNVPYREGILIHPGNTSKDTQGCILPGLDVDGAGVIHSRLAMQRLLSELPDAFSIQIKDAV